MRRGISWSTRCLNGRLSEALSGRGEKMLTSILSLDTKAVDENLSLFLRRRSFYCVTNVKHPNDSCFESFTWHHLLRDKFGKDRNDAGMRIDPGRSMHSSSVRHQEPQRQEESNGAWLKGTPGCSRREIDQAIDTTETSIGHDEKTWQSWKQARKEACEAKQAREMHAVNTAVKVNCGIFIAKVATWTMTSSGALFAEALHSMADIVNQLLLRAGVQQSRRPPTAEHPFGFGREKYVYALMSAVGVFCVGAGASLVHGIQALIDPPNLEHMGYSLGVLSLAAIGEFYSLRVALSAMKVSANETGQSIWSFMMHGRDPTTAAVLAEDAGAVAGLGIAGISAYLTWTTGNPMYDAVGSIAVGCLMGAVAVTLIRNNKRFLIGKAMSPEMHHLIVEKLRRDPMVLGVVDPKSEEIGDGIFRFKAEIQWSADRIVSKYLKMRVRKEDSKPSLYSKIQSACMPPGAGPESDALQNAMDLAMFEVGRGVIRTMGEEVDRLEEELKSMVPGLAYVDLETDRGRIGDESMRCIIKSIDEIDILKE